MGRRIDEDGKQARDGQHQAHSIDQRSVRCINQETERRFAIFVRIIGGHRYAFDSLSCWLRAQFLPFVVDALTPFLKLISLSLNLEIASYETCSADKLRILKYWGFDNSSSFSRCARGRWIAGRPLSLESGYEIIKKYNMPLFGIFFCWWLPHAAERRRVENMEKS